MKQPHVEAGWSLFKPGFLLAVLALPLLVFAPALRAAPDAVSGEVTNAAGGGTKEVRLAALEQERTNAINGVLKIVNQPVRAYVRTGNISVTTYRPGWFHEGATRPDFNTVDVRQSQELIYAKDKFVTSDLNPGIVFLGQDLEFNAMTKYFYTNRTLPKKKLMEAEMLEINRLYRIIGRCEADISKLKMPPEMESAQSANPDATTEEVVPGQSFESIRQIPKQTRVLYGSIAIGTLVLLVIVLRLLRKKSA